MFKKISTFISLFMASMILALLQPVLAFASPEPSFVCEVKDHPVLNRNGMKLGSSIYYGGEFVGLIGYPEMANEKLPRVRSGSGEQYSDGVLTFHSKADKGVLIIEGGPTFPCKAFLANAQSGGAQNDYSVLANALETIIRAKPDVKAKRIDQLSFREPIELVEATGIYFQDFQWFKVRYGEGEEGYAWGGTMCVETKESGILIGCERFNLSSRVPSAHQVIANAKSLFGSKVRQSPDLNAPQLFSLPQGTPIFVMQESGSFYDGWQWVKIQTSGETGYVWGGTICTLDKQLPGVHFGCE
ncbi:MAG: SH3 domain-containing protein [Nitratireductor sp.]